MKTNGQFLFYPANFFLKLKYLRTNSRENQKRHFVFSNLFLENRAVYEIILKKYCRAVQATDDNMAHAHYMLDN